MFPHKSKPVRFHTAGRKMCVQIYE